MSASFALPWRPSKLRLLVEAQRCFGARMSGFMPRHIEHPGSRHCAPASLKIRSRPSSFGGDASPLPNLERPARSRSGCTLCPLNYFRGGPQIFQAAVGARADENAVKRDVFDARARRQSHVFQRRKHGRTLGCVAGVVRDSECSPSPAPTFRDSFPRSRSAPASRRRW